MIFHPISYNLEQIKSHSEGEYDVFKEFIRIDDKRTKDWHLYYSYYYRKREKVDGIRIHDNNEIDFLVLAPNVGIFVLEVKGGFIKNSKGRLFSIDRFHKMHFIDPYNQAKNNYYGISNIINDLSKKKIDLRKYISGPLVALPNCAKFIDIPQSNGSDTYLKNMDMYKFIINASKELLNDNQALIKPSKEEIEELVAVLDGPEFEYKLSKKDYIESINLAINDLTDEQFAIFRGLLKNKRCLINGMAGTGKTVLCEFLFKELTIESKKKVLYLSYNSLVSGRVKTDLLNYNEDLIDSLESGIDTMNYDERVKSFIKNVSKLINDNKISKYDALILDEAQDIDLSDDILSFLDNLIIGGLKDGLVYIFYDENQTVYGNNKKIYEADNFLDSMYRYAKFDLIKNCRNGNGIKDAIDDMFITKKLDLSISNEDVKYCDIDNTESYATKVIEDIDKLIKDGISYNQITILVDDKKNNHVLDSIISHYKDKIDEYKENSNRKLTYSLSSSFKGLENDVIFYISVNKKTKFDLHYVAISRAKALAFIYKIKS